MYIRQRIKYEIWKGNVRYWSNYTVYIIFFFKLQKYMDMLNENRCPVCNSMTSGYGNAWWRHQMETFSALLAICAGNSPVPGEFPTQRPVTRSFDVYFDLRPDKRLSKQSWGWWFETPSRPLWRHRNGFPHCCPCVREPVATKRFPCNAELWCFLYG